MYLNASTIYLLGDGNAETRFLLSQKLSLVMEIDNKQRGGKYKMQYNSYLENKIAETQNSKGHLI